jgi:hypothetical protein
MSKVNGGGEPEIAITDSLDNIKCIELELE